MTVKRRNKNILNLSLAISSNPGRAEVAAAQDKIKLLKILVLELQRELESLSNGHIADVERALDFYHEVSRFEIELIRRTLIFMGGHQGNAAQHLNMKATTLSAKIKHLLRPTRSTSRSNDNAQEWWRRLSPQMRCSSKHPLLRGALSAVDALFFVILCAESQIAMTQFASFIADSSALRW